jgi:hypothetical protein
MSDRVVMPFDPSLPVTSASAVASACDASPTGFAGVFSHVVNGVERPVTFISRSLTHSERNYSQLDREALAIIFCVSQLLMYLFGRHFTLITDYQLLTRIFHPDSKLPSFTSSRLFRYATFLQEFDYSVEHRKAEHHSHVDCIFRATSETIYFNNFIETVMSQEVQTLEDQSVHLISNETITSSVPITS